MTKQSFKTKKKTIIWIALLLIISCFVYFLYSYPKHKPSFKITSDPKIQFYTSETKKQKEIETHFTLSEIKDDIYVTVSIKNVSDSPIIYQADESISAISVYPSKKFLNAYTFQYARDNFASYDKVTNKHSKEPAQLMPTKSIEKYIYYKKTSSFQGMTKFDIEFETDTKTFKEPFAYVKD